MIWFLAALGLLGLTGFTARCATDRGRSAAGWAALSTLAGVAGLLAGILLVSRGVGKVDESSLSLGGFALSLVVFLLGPLVAMLAVLGGLILMPDFVPRVGGDRWPVYRMSNRDVPGGDCMLSVEADGVRIGDEFAPTRDIGEIEVDGEYLRVSWTAGSVLVMPKNAPTAQARTRRSLALRKRLMTLLGRA